MWRLRSKKYFSQVYGALAWCPGFSAVGLGIRSKGAIHSLNLPHFKSSATPFSQLSNSTCTSANWRRGKSSLFNSKLWGVKTVGAIYAFLEVEVSEPKRLEWHERWISQGWHFSVPRVVLRPEWFSLSSVERHSLIIIHGKISARSVFFSLQFFRIHICVMATLSRLMDISSPVSVESILQRTQKDDYAFLAFIILCGIFYNLYIKQKPDPYYHIWFEKPQQTYVNAGGTDTRDIGEKLEETVCLLNQIASFLKPNIAAEKRSRYLLGLPVWNSRSPRQPSSTRLSEKISTRCTRCGPVRLWARVYCEYSGSQICRLHYVHLWWRWP